MAVIAGFKVIYMGLFQLGTSHLLDIKPTIKPAACIAVCRT